MKHRQAKRHRRSSSSDSCTSSTSSTSTDSISTSSSSTSSSSSSSSTEDSRKNIKRRHKRSKSSDDDVRVKTVKHSKLHTIKKKIKKSAKKSNPLKNTKLQQKPDAIVETSECSDIPITLMNNAPKSLAPLTKEEWEKQQSKVKKVFDETTGRYRLIKGDGEVLEEIVSHERHKAINKQATTGDGDYFQAKVNVNAGLSTKK